MSISIDQAENYQYITLPISHIRKEKFRRILPAINGGDVLDLGCGYTGHYWALGYAHKIDSLSFYDLVEENIHEQADNIEKLSPYTIEEYFSDTLDFLYQESLLPADLTSTDIANNIIGKTIDIRTFDFMIDKSDAQFDTILSMEGVEVADTYDQLISTFKNVKSMLRPKGKFLGVTMSYDQVLPGTQKHIDMRRDGRLNPGSEMLRKAFSETGWILEEADVFKTLTPNYEYAMFFVARHAD